MLPTFLFILAAYLLGATARFWSRRASRRWRDDRESRLHRLAWITGLAVVLCLVWVAMRGGSESQDRSLRLASMVGAGRVESSLPVQPDLPLEGLTKKASGPEGQPAFALLHPETPPSLILPDKTISPAKLRPAKGKSRPAPVPPKKVKSAPALAKEKIPAKEKPAARNRPKGKKAAPAATRPAPQVQAAAR